MRRLTRPQRENGATLAVLILALVSAIPAIRWNRFYGPWIWAIGWGVHLLTALALIVIVSALRAAHARRGTPQSRSDRPNVPGDR